MHERKGFFFFFGSVSSAATDIYVYEANYVMQF